MDAITLLKHDHKTVEQLFKRFEKAGDKAYKSKREIADRIIEELSIHAAIEEQLFYPVTRATVDDVDDVVLESLEEHHIVKWVLSEIQGMDPEDERFDAKVTVLIENVRHHVEEEESEYFPKVRDQLSRKALGDLGEALAQAKKTAPTHPHPRSPDTPPGNLVVGAAAGMADKIGDTVSGLAQGGVAVAQDLINRITGGTDTPSTRGSTVTRQTASKVRAGGASAARTASRTVERSQRAGRATTSGAARTARSTARTARSGAKGTATAAKSGATKTARAARSGARTTATKTKAAASR